VVDPNRELICICFLPFAGEIEGDPRDPRKDPA